MGEPNEDGQVGYSCSVDIWALGCTLFEVMMLEKTFTGRNKYETLQNVIHARYGDIRGDWSVDLKELLESMLDRVSFRRPKASQMLELPLFRELLDKDEDGIRSVGLRHKAAQKVP